MEVRKNYIDWLKCLCILYLFPFHTSRIFTFSEGEAYYVQGAVNSFSTNLIWMSFWFMPLMFLMAGMSSRFSLKKRSNAKYIKERFLRLFVPFIFGMLIFIPPQGYFAAKFNAGYNGSFLLYLKRFFTDFSDLRGYSGSFTPGVLWFILFLFIISLVVLPIMRTIMSHNLKFKIFKSPVKITLIGVLLTVASALPSVGGKNIFVYGLLMIAGFIMASDDSIIDMIEKYRLYYLLITLMGAAVILIEIHTIGWKTGFSLLGIIFSIIYYLIVWISLLAFVGYGKRYLNFRTKFLSYFSKASFPIYMIHHTYLIIIGYFVLKTVKVFIFQYVLIMVLTFAVSILTYEIIKRFKVTRFMFGIK